MIEIIQYCTSSFWVFIGSAILMSSFLFYTVNGTVRVMNSFLLMVMVSFRGWPKNNLKNEETLKFFEEIKSKLEDK